MGKGGGCYKSHVLSFGDLSKDKRKKRVETQLPLYHLGGLVLTVQDKFK